jgi:hypothetical protein
LDGSFGEVFRQVEAMREIGLLVPPVSEAADCLNRRLKTDYAFTRLEEAFRTLGQRLSEN